MHIPIFSRVRQNPLSWILAGYISLWFAHWLLTALPGGETVREQRGFALQHVLRMSRPLLEGDHARELTRYLRDAQATGLVDYFQFDHNGKLETAGQVPGRRPVLTEAVSEDDGWVWGRAEGRETTLRLASGYGWRTRLALAFRREVTRFPFDLLFVAFATAICFLFQARARRQAARGAIESGSLRREAKRAKAQRTEATRKTEIGEFDGVCGRTSLLNQAELAGGDPEKFFAFLEEFYADCSAVLARYQGKLHGVHGHELLFYFHENNAQYETRLALAAARDLEALAARHGFRLGTALAHGHLHGAHLLSGFALFGTPVEETADLIQALATQKESAIWCAESLLRHAGAHATFRALPHGARKLSAKVAEVSASIEPALAAARNGNFAELAFHRGDAALAAVFLALGSEPGWERDVYVGAVTELRRVPCRRCGPDVVEAYRALLSAELARKDTYRLSAVVALAAAVLGRAAVDRPMERLFLQAVAVKDRRVRANAVELFTKFFPERELPELRSLIRDEDNRVSANALIKAACERFDEKVILRLEERVRGGSVAHVASALHAMGEIAVYYRKHDPLFLGTKHSFLRLFENLPGLASHPNTMIRRQALIAAHKLQSDPLDARLRELFAGATDPELLGLFASIYHWRKDPARKAA